MRQVLMFEQEQEQDRPGFPAPELGLRDYQKKARASIAEHHKSHAGTLVVLPTGTGKSRLAGAVAWDHKVVGSKVLILCPTIVLCRQMYSDMRALGLSVDIEQASNVARRPLPDVTVASVDSMRGSRLARFARDAFGLVIADEAHRSVSGKYEAIFSHFSTAKRLGLTATPDRSDGVALANVFDSVAYEMSMLDAISLGWLAPIRFRTAHTDFDARRLRTIAGDVDPSSVVAELTRSRVLYEAANTLADLSGDHRAVAFLPTVAASKAFCVEINARHQRPASALQYAAHIDGETPESARNEIFAAYKAGDVRVISNVGVLCEGWDAPHATVLALLSPTKSRSRLCQQIGRITRPFAGKEFALVIDFCPGRMKKGRLASPADALAGKMLPDKVHERMAKEGDVAAEIKAAEIKAEQIEERKARAAERAKARERARLALRSEANAYEYKYLLESHDARALMGGRGVADLSPTEHASLISVAEEERRRRGLCSIKQANLMRKYGLNPNMTSATAGVAIALIKAAKWVVPAWMYKDRRFARFP